MVAVVAGLILLGVQIYFTPRETRVTARPYVLKRGTIVPQDLPPDVRRCLAAQGDKKPWEYDWAACGVINEK